MRNWRLSWGVMGPMLALVVLVLAVFLAYGCTASGEVDTARVQAEMDAAKVQLYEARQVFEAQALSPDAVTQAKARETLAIIADLEAKAARVDDVLAKALNPDGSVNVPGVAATVGMAMPPPWNLITMLGIPLVVGGIQELRKRKAVEAVTTDAKSIVNGIDALRANSPTVKAEMDANTEVIHAQLTPGAAALIKSERVV